MNSLSISVIIATRNRCEPLRTTLATLGNQSLLPGEVWIVDSSDSGEAMQLIEALRPESSFPLNYLSSQMCNAAQQRNRGAEQATGDLLVFVDDDVRLDPRFLEELVRPFNDDRDGRLAGVSGTITNQIYTQPKGLNRFLLSCCIGNFDSCWAGRIVGPAVNFLPLDIPNTVQSVEWLCSTGTAYRKDVFQRYRFDEHFAGYSFAEDLHLSVRIAQEYRICNTTLARFEHLDLGRTTHRSWVVLGRSIVANRRTVMVDVLNRDSLADLVRLFAYEVLYCSLAMIVQERFQPRTVARIAALVWGKLQELLRSKPMASLAKQQDVTSTVLATTFRHDGCKALPRSPSSTEVFADARLAGMCFRASGNLQVRTPEEFDVLERPNRPLTADTLSTTVIIATRNRCEPLRTTLSDLRDQSVLPGEVLVVDSSDTHETRDLIDSLLLDSPFTLRYLRSEVRSAAGQRNLGADQATGDLLVFMDDDVRLSGQFLEELVHPFYYDPDRRIAGVSGTIVNQTYTQPKGLNRFLLSCCIGNFDSCWAGRLVGPAVNFLPEDKPDVIQAVDWLFSGGTAYRRDIFANYRFGLAFTGYSFAEDLHLSARIGRKYLLVNTTRARFEHLDLGQHTHRDWVALGESMVVNRRSVMVDVLGKNRLADRMRLFAYEVLYCSVAAAVQSRFKPRQLGRIARLILGKLRAFFVVWRRPTAISRTA